MRRTWHFFAEEQWQIGIWMISVITLMCANSYFFPLSTFSLLIDIPSSCAYILFLVSLFILGFLVVNSFIYTNRIILFIFLVLLSSAIYWTNYLPKKEKQIQSPMPNIIFLGIDSLSPESVTPINMPFLNNLLQKNTQFTNSISPLARTYPAWSSILTGLYAQHHHAQENLMPKRLVNSQASMVWLLNQKGYNSIFATDDRRFNGIDTDFGFNKIIGPKIGVNDVLLGSFNDFPLSNLMINTAISSWLFPYNYINRASFYLYYPATFSAKLEYALARENANKPLFLAVHFTLPHWPYAWAESSPLQLNNEFSLENRNSLYQASLHRV
ncbi:MAG: sulfatase-like hydrolase/transferase, partial [bacterium]|nr:sulfatase-like hydrolase/transferase [bacterium]